MKNGCCIGTTFVKKLVAVVFIKWAHDSNGTPGNVTRWFSICLCVSKTHSLTRICLWPDYAFCQLRWVECKWAIMSSFFISQSSHSRSDSFFFFCCHCSFFLFRLLREPMSNSNTKWSVHDQWNYYTTWTVTRYATKFNVIHFVGIVFSFY